MDTLLKTLGWLVIGYGIGGIITTSIYAMMAGLDFLSAVAIFISWPFWAFVLITGGK